MRPSTTATLASGLCTLCYLMAWKSDGWFRVGMFIAGSVFGVFALLVMLVTSQGE